MPARRPEPEPERERDVRDEGECVPVPEWLSEPGHAIAAGVEAREASSPRAPTAITALVASVSTTAPRRTPSRPAAPASSIPMPRKARTAALRLNVSQLRSGAIDQVIEAASQSTEEGEDGPERDSRATDARRGKQPEADGGESHARDHDRRAADRQDPADAATRRRRTPRRAARRATRPRGGRRPCRAPGRTAQAPRPWAPRLAPALKKTSALTEQRRTRQKKWGRTV